MALERDCMCAWEIEWCLKEREKDCKQPNEHERERETGRERERERVKE